MKSVRSRKVKKSVQSRKVKKSVQSRKVKKSVRSRKAKKSVRSRKAKKSRRLLKKKFDGAKTCNECTYINDDELTNCEVCGIRLNELSDEIKEKEREKVLKNEKKEKEKELEQNKSKLEKERNEKNINDLKRKKYILQKQKSAISESLGEGAEEFKKEYTEDDYHGTKLKDLKETWVPLVCSEIHAVMMAYLMKTKKDNPFHFYDKITQQITKSKQIPVFKANSTLGPRDTYRFIIIDYLTKSDFNKYYYKESNHLELKSFYGRSEILEFTSNISKSDSNGDYKITNKAMIFDILSDILEIKICVYEENDDESSTEEIYNRSSAADDTIIYIKSTKESATPLVDGTLTEFSEFAKSWREGMFKLFSKTCNKLGMNSIQVEELVDKLKANIWETNI
jgi:hypothetical protein